MQIILRFSKLSGVLTFLFVLSSLILAMNPLQSEFCLQDNGSQAQETLSCLCALVTLDLVFLKGESSGVFGSWRSPCSAAQCLPVGRAQ